MPGSQPPYLVFATYRRFCAAINTVQGGHRRGTDAAVSAVFSTIAIAASNTPAFKPGKTLRETVN